MNQNRSKLKKEFIKKSKDFLYFNHFNADFDKKYTDLIKQLECVKNHI